MWDRDGSPKYYGWDHLHARVSRSISSSQAARAKVEDRETTDKQDTQPWREFHNDFESFKDAVDRAIQRDPYGTLFGRRLRSPETSNNASWTSWSWIFDPKEIKEEPQVGSASEKQSVQSARKDNNPLADTSNTAAGTAQQAKAQPAIGHTTSSQRTTTTIRSSQSFVFQDSTSNTAEYVYDPITGRKVPRWAVEATTTVTSNKTPRSDFPKWKSAAEDHGQVAQSSAEDVKAAKVDSPLNVTSNPPPIKAEQLSKNDTQPQSKSFIETMFGEHGVDIPVKTYKPHKVHGYTGETKSIKASDLTGKDNSKGSLGTSRKREYEQLRLRTIGNNIDSTNFNAEPWNKTSNDDLPMYDAATAKAPETITQISGQQAESVKDTQAPFTGTTYETKAKEILTPINDWLSKEGFRARQGMTMPTLKESRPADVQSMSKPPERIEPALDRAQKGTSTEIVTKRDESRLQPSLDRAIPPSSVLKSDASFDSKPTERGQEEAKRAQQGLEALEKQRIARRGRHTVPRITSAFSTPDSPAQTGTTHTAREEQEKREDLDLLRASDIRAASRSARDTKQDLESQKSQDRALFEKDFVASTPRTPEDLDLLHARDVRAAIKARTRSDEQFQKLDTELRTIISQHLTPESEPVVKQTVATTFRPKFSEPTVKSGVERDLAMERHTQVFEPHYAQIVDKVKAIGKVSKSIAAQIQTVEIEKALSTPSKASKAETTSTDAIETAENEIFEAPMIVLRRDGQNVTLEPHYDTFVTNQLKIQNFTTYLAGLQDPAPLLNHFPQLDRMGYELTHGDQTDLFFKKRGLNEQPKQDRASMKKNLSRKIAAEEVAAQPTPGISLPKQAANVLDEIPVSIPTPGPAAPTAPPTTSVPVPEVDVIKAEYRPRHKKPKSHKISRQEQVFSGQQRLKAQTTALPDPEHFQKQNPAANTAYQHYEQYSEPQGSWFSGVVRFIRRTFMTIGAIVAIGTGAYGIGVLAEGVQGKKQISQGESGGPMKRLVLDGGAKQSERQRTG